MKKMNKHKWWALADRICACVCLLPHSGVRSQAAHLDFTQPSLDGERRCAKVAASCVAWWLNSWELISVKATGGHKEPMPLGLGGIHIASAAAHLRPRSRFQVVANAHSPRVRARAGAGVGARHKFANNVGAPASVAGMMSPPTGAHNCPHSLAEVANKHAHAPEQLDKDRGARASQLIVLLRLA